MTISWLNGKHFIYGILGPNHVNNMWVKDRVVDSFWYVNIDRIPDRKKGEHFLYSVFLQYH